MPLIFWCIHPLPLYKNKNRPVAWVIHSGKALRGNRNDFGVLRFRNLLVVEPNNFVVWPNTINQTRQKNKTTARVVIFFGGSGWIRTTSVVRQQIYSLPRLSNSGARPIPGASRGNRTLISSLEGLHSSL